MNRIAGNRVRTVEKHAKRMLAQWLRKLEIALRRVSTRMNRSVARFQPQVMETMQSMRLPRDWPRLALQLGLYAIIATGAVNITYLGGNRLLALLSAEMSALGSDVARTTVSETIQTANLRETFRAPGTE